MNIRRQKGEEPVTAESRAHVNQHLSHRYFQRIWMKVAFKHQLVQTHR